MAGLKKIQGLLQGGALELGKLDVSDRAFALGMAKDQANLFGPSQTRWESPFTSQTGPLIHGVLKVAGNKPTMVEERLTKITNLLGGTIADVASPTSRVVGRVRDGTQRGHEHFGFEDGISQPLLDEIDEKSPAEIASKNIAPNINMRTAQNVITVVDPKAKNRPLWMQDGSFLVFRKLEQDVGAFRELIQKGFQNPSLSSAQLGAKLMGRWPSGKPVTTSPFDKDVETDADLKTAKEENNFDFKDNSVCPLAAHIRKTNSRNLDFKPLTARIVRNGIPYGFDFDAKAPNPTSTARGLLFACYQSSIEAGYQRIQKTWANSPSFPPGNAGLDAFMGQLPPVQQSNGVQKPVVSDTKHVVNLFIDSKDTTGKPLPVPKPLVTMKGGEYFFVPSITALTTTLAGKT